MEWIILFAVSWILFFLFANWKKVKFNIWGGLVAALMQICVDTNAISHNFYVINRPGVSFLGSSLFFITGPVLVMGILISQYHPKGRWLRVINVIMFTALYSLQEFLLLKTGALAYNEWNFIDSLLVNVAAMIVISWFSIVVLEEKGTELE